MSKTVKRFLSIALTALFVCGVVAMLPTSSYAAEDAGVTMYRLYNENTGEHFYTQSENEYATLGSIGWVQEGRAWVAPTSSLTPVYRLYNPNTGDHHYTTSVSEYEGLGKLGWVKEGRAWYSDDAKGVPIYRLFNPNASVGTHHYTQSKSEYDALGKLGWVQEGVAWYGVDPDAPNENDAPVLITKTPIMGSSSVTVNDLVSYYKSTGAIYPSDVYEKYGAATIEDFCTILVEEAKAEGVKAEVLFAQVCVETGNLRFGGRIKSEQCNFGGLGATDSGAPGADFSSYGEDGVRIGLRAQVQHLKAYASTEKLNNKCVDPRFSLVKRGSAPLVENLGNGNWASDPTYASKLLRVMSSL